MKVAPAFLQTFVSQVVQSIASITTAALIARGLGPAGQGQYAQALAAVGLLATIGAGGQYEGHVLLSGGEASRGRILVMRSLIQAGIVGLVLALSQPIWRQGLSLLDGGLAARLLVPILMLEVLALLLRGINLGQHHILAYNLATMIQRAFLLAVVGVLTLVQNVRIEVVLTAWLGAVALNVMISGFWIWRRSSPVTVRWLLILEGWGRSLGTGVRALVTVTLTLLLLRIDVYMLGPMLNAPAVGQLSVASTLAEYLWYVPSILASVLFAAVAADQGPASIEKICRASRMAVLILAPVTLILAFIGKWLVPLIYGQEFQPAGEVFAVLLPGMLAISLHLVVDSYFAGRGFPPVSYLAAGGALLMKVGLNLLLVPRMGLLGAALATSATYIALLATKVEVLRREAGVRLKIVFLPTREDVTRGLSVARAWLDRPRRA